MAGQSSTIGTDVQIKVKKDSLGLEPEGRRLITRSTATRPGGRTWSFRWLCTGRDAYQEVWALRGRWPS